MRDGRIVYRGAPRSSPSSGLIEHITGSAEAAPERRERRVTLADRGDEELLRVEGLTLPGVVEDASFSAPRGRAARDRRPRRRRPHRARPADLRRRPRTPPAGSSCTAGRWPIRGAARRAARGHRAAAGGPPAPGQRRSTSRCARTSRCPTLRAPPDAVVRCRSPTTAASASTRGRSSSDSDIKVANAEQPVRSPLRRQPAEGGAGQVAGVGRRRLHLRRAHPRHRRRRQGGDLPADGGARRLPARA